MRSFEAELFQVVAEYSVPIPGVAGDGERSSGSRA